MQNVEIKYRVFPQLLLKKSTWYYHRLAGRSVFSANLCKKNKKNPYFISKSYNTLVWIKGFSWGKMHIFFHRIKHVFSSLQTLCHFVWNASLRLISLEEVFVFYSHHWLNNVSKADFRWNALKRFLSYDFALALSCSENISVPKTLSSGHVKH